MVETCWGNLISICPHLIVFISVNRNSETFNAYEKDIIFFNVFKIEQTFYNIDCLTKTSMKMFIDLESLN